MEIEWGIKNIQRVREFVGSLPTKQMKKEFKNILLDEREFSTFSQEDLELIFISDHWDELVELGWLTE